MEDQLRTSVCPKEVVRRSSMRLACSVSDSRCQRLAERPLCAKSDPSLTIIIYVRNIFGLATKESSHPSMMATSRATTSAVPPTADIVGQCGHVRKVPLNEPALAGGAGGAVGRLRLPP